MQTSDRVELRLTLFNVAVFATVLIAFSATVFFFVADKQNQDIRADVRKLADAAIASIDFDEDKSRHPNSARPDLIDSAMPDSSAMLLNNLKLQWFNYEQKLLAEKGTFKIAPSLQTTEGFQFQENPKGIIFSKPVFDNGRLLGYVRVAQPLDKYDRFVANLLMGLSVGIVIALLLTAVGVFLLVKQSIFPLRKSMRLLRQFTNDASHELRTPVAAIRSNTAVALKYPEGMRFGDKEKFEMIDSAAKQMQHLIENLLALSRAENLKTTATLCDLAQVVDEVYRSLLPIANEASVDVQVRVPSRLQLLIAKDNLFSIVSNLLENAVRYTPAGGRIDIQAESQNGHIVLTVKDNGVGIAPDDIDKVYDRFWRADQARTAHSAGQGLGLAITKRLVDEQGGIITVNSELGKGTTFKVLLGAHAH